MDPNSDSEVDQPMATVFLKDGKDIKIPFDQVEEWMQANPDKVEPRNLPVRGKRRVATNPSSNDPC